MDQAATEIKRQQTVQEVLTVYDNDTELGRPTRRIVEWTFAELRAMRQAALEQRVTERWFRRWRPFHPRRSAKPSRNKSASASARRASPP